MKKFRYSTFFVVSIFLLLTTGCGSSNIALNSSKKTNQLQPGMTYDQVVEILGKPKSTEMKDGQWIARWVLQEMWVGYIPYDMVFNPQTKTLVSWAKNEKDFKKSQENLKVIAYAIEEASAETGSGGSSGNGNASTTGPNDENLMRQFAVKLYYFSAVGGGQTGGSERTIHLCPNGKFQASSESGYSGDGWGTAGEGGDHGTWRITGNMQKGEIVFVYSTGKAWKYNYTRVEGDYVTLDGTKYGIAGRPTCQ